MRRVAWIGAVMVVLLLASQMGYTKTEDPYSAFKRFSQILHKVESHYVHEVSRDELINGAIKGMLQTLDPHSAYLLPEDFQEMQISTSGEFGGIGIEISVKNSRLTVVAPIEDTPAYRAGIKAGDIILGINGESTQDITIMDAVKKIRGPKGTSVKLTILHPTETRATTIAIKRDTIPIRGAKSEVLEEGYLYLRLIRFNENTSREMQTAIRNYKKKHQLKGIVLDMRNNPGGLLDQAVSVADTFLSGGNIVYLQGRGEKARKDFDSKNQSTDIKVPMVVLINAGSASASEIVAGALQDHKRAVLLGEATFGKATVQSIIPMADGSGIKLTTAMYYTPGGRSIQAEGIVPDIVLPFIVPEKSGQDKQNMVFREKNLSGHIEGAGEKEAVHSEELGEQAQKMLKNDNQLRMALQLVKKIPALAQISSGN